MTTGKGIIIVASAMTNTLFRPRQGMRANPYAASALENTVPMTVRTQRMSVFFRYITKVSEKMFLIRVDMCSYR